MVNLRAMINVEHMNDAGVLVDPVHDAIGTAPGAVTTSERAEQWLANAMRVGCKRSIAEFQHRGCHSFWESLCYGSPRGRLKRTSYGCVGSVVTRRWRGVGQILADGGHISAGITTAKSCQALRDARYSLGVTQDFQGHLQTLQVIHGQQDRLSLSVTGKGDPLVLLADSPN